MNIAELLAAMDSLAAEKPRAVTIKGLGPVHIRQLTIGEVDAQIADAADGKNKRATARGACRLLADEHGNRLLDPDDDEHVAKMARLPWRVLRDINAAIDEGTAEGN